jgi:Flp pilus assembly CpaE family ATPase
VSTAKATDLELGEKPRWQRARDRKPLLPTAVESSPRARRERRRGREQWPSPAEMANRLAVLQQSAVFFAQPDSMLRLLARRLRPLEADKGTLLAVQDEPGDSIFFIVQGSCQLAIERAPGHRVVVAVLGPGDFFGEAACVLDERHHTHAVALTNCKLMLLDRASLYAVLHPGSAELAQFVKLAHQRKAAYAETAAQASWSTLLGEAPVVAVYAPKGGSGATTVALNLVGALSRRHPGEILLLDLDLPYNHAALLANLVPTSCLARLGAIPEDAFDDVLLSAALYHSGGPMILPGALRPEEADLVTPELIARALTVLRRSFRFVIVDLGVALSDSVLAVVDHVQHILLLVTPEVSAIKAAADALEIMVTLGVSPERISIVLNHRSVTKAVPRAGIERMLRRPVDVEIPFDASRPDDAAVHGNILSLTDSKSELSKSAEVLADLLETAHPAPLSEGVGAAPVDLGRGGETW